MLLGEGGVTSGGQKVAVPSILAAVVLGSTAGVLTDVFQAWFETRGQMHTQESELPGGIFPAGLNQCIDPRDSSSQTDAGLNKHVFVNDEFTDATDSCGSYS